MKIYLACPYSDEADIIQELRFKLVSKAAGKLMNQGHIVFSPISHSRPIALQCILPHDWEFWENFDKNFIEWCDQLWVLCLDGWKESVGVTAEIKIAKELKKSVWYLKS